MTFKKGMSRRDFLKMGAAAAGAVAAGGVMINPQTASANVRGLQNLASHVTIGNTSIQSNLNPFYFTYFQARQIYDTLIEVDVDGGLLPGLATEWNRVDPTTMEVTLRDDVFFSNGDRFTSRSVQFTLEFLLTVGVANLGTYAIPITDLVLFPPPFALLNQESIEIIDDTNFVIRTTRPDPILERRLSRMFIISEQFINDTDADLVNQAAGTGYFQVVDWTPGERLDLETWDGNWRGEYPIQTATYVRVGDPRVALESGDVDIAHSISPDIARTMIDSGDWVETSKPELGVQIVSMIPDTNEALQDPRVRRALNLAVDKELYNEVIEAGFGRPPTGQMLQPGIDGYNDDLEAFPYDPAEAMRLLNEAGYSNLSLTMAAPNTLRAQAETIASFFEAIGVSIELETPDSGTIINEVTNGTDRNLILWNAFYTTLQDWSQAMVGILPQQPGGQVHFNNPDFLALNQQIVAAPDAETRTDLIEQAAAVMNEEAGVVFLSWNDFVFVHSPQVTNLPLNLDNSPQIYAIEKLEA